MSDERRVSAMFRLASEGAWAIHQPMLWTIREILDRHWRGEKLSADEIEARVSSGRSRPSAQTGRVAVIPLWGVLVPHAGQMVDTSTPGTGIDAWAQMFQEAVDDSSVDTIVLRVHSPGGFAAGITEVAKVVRDAKATKRIIAVADGMACSAAYAIASQAESLYVTPSGVVGSVGVYDIHEDVSEAIAAQGVKPTIIQAPEDGYKTELSPFGPLTDEARAHMQEQVNACYRTFVSDVSKGRGVSTSEVEANYGRGRALNAQQALGAGMVDGIASFDDVLSKVTAGKALPGAKQELDQPAVRQLGAAVADASSSFAGAGGGTALAVVDISTGGGGGGGVAATLIGGGGGGSGTAQQVGVAGSSAGTTTTFDQPSAASQTARTADPAIAEQADTNERSSTMEGSVTLDGRPPTLEELAAQQNRVTARIAELNDLAAGRMFSAEENQEYETLNEQHDTLAQTIVELKQRNARMAKIGKTGGGLSGDGAAVVEHADGGGLTILGDSRRGLPDNLFAVHDYRRFAASHDQLSAKLKDGARHINEKLPYASSKPDRARAMVDALIAGEKAADSRDAFTQRFFATAEPDYERQFARWLETGSDLDKPKMAVSIGGLGSETPIPITIDPTVLLDSDGSTNPIRRISRNITITGNVWRGIATEGVTFTYDGELAPVDPQTPDFRAPEAEVVKAQAEVQFSIEVDQDWSAFRSELVRMFTDAKNVKESDAFLHGTGPGTNQPEGLVYALDVDDTSVVRTATANATGIADIRALDAALPPRFEDSAEWLANKAFYALGNSLSRAESNYDIWIPISQGVNTASDGRLRYTLLGSPTNSSSEMSKLFTTGGENVAVLGDFSRGFAVIDRVGMNVELDPLVRDSNGKLIGARALYIYFRNTSKLLSANAFRMLQVKST